MKLRHLSAGIFLSIAGSLQAQPEADYVRADAERSYFALKHSVVQWESMAFNQYLGLQNARALNTHLAGNPVQTPFFDGPPKDVRASNGLSLIFSMGLNKGLLSAGPSRATFTFESYSTDPQFSNLGYTIAAGRVNNNILLGSSNYMEFSQASKLKYQSLNYDHELYFASRSSGAFWYGTGLWMGFGFQQDKYTVSELRVGQSQLNNLTTGASSSPITFRTREGLSSFFSSPTRLGIVHRMNINEKWLTDVRVGYIWDNFGTGKVETEGFGTNSAAGLAANTPSLPYGNKYKYETSASGTHAEVGLTYKINNTLAVRAHYQDRITRTTLKVKSFTPEVAAQVGGVSGYSTTQIFLTLFVEDILLAPTSQTDRRRAGGLELQVQF